MIRGILYSFSPSCGRGPNTRPAAPGERSATEVLESEDHGEVGSTVPLATIVLLPQLRRPKRLTLSLPLHHLLLSRPCPGRGGVLLLRIPAQHVPNGAPSKPL
ncbi:hypothetical protein LIER_37754 [Lithospermum erythrorhizon]|uniref:Uncharacterized protein n=1 Tax=Lithospermum erythrorhizon TaxID=34254 RepID=A0AAV3PU55_LITER